jgi:hypothetical protein
MIPDKLPTFYTGRRMQRFRRASPALIFLVSTTTVAQNLKLAYAGWLIGYYGQDIASEPGVQSYVKMGACYESWHNTLRLSLVTQIAVTRKCAGRTTHKQHISVE